MKLFYEEYENGKYIKTYGDENLDVRLDEIVKILHRNADVKIKRIDIEETAELDMQDFGSDSFTPDQLTELHRFCNTEKYLYNIFLDCCSVPVELSILNKTVILSSDDPDLELSDIWEYKK